MKIHTTWLEDSLFSSFCFSKKKKKKKMSTLLIKPYNVYIHVKDLHVIVMHVLYSDIAVNYCFIYHQSLKNT